MSFLPVASLQSCRHYGMDSCRALSARHLLPTSSGLLKTTTRRALHRHSSRHLRPRSTPRASILTRTTPAPLLSSQHRFLSDESPKPDTPVTRGPSPSNADLKSPSHTAAKPPSTKPLTKPISQTLSAAAETTKSVRATVRSSLKNVNPHENIYNLPNFLTVTRLFAAPATAYLLLHDHHAWALGLFAYAGITDLVDGYLARKWKLQTVAGSVMDPMADKALMIIVTVTLAVKGAIPLYLATLILGRDASLALAALYYRYASLPSPKTFLRYWDFSLPSAEVHPTTVSKYNTLLQLLLIGATLTLPVLTATPTLASSLANAGVSDTVLANGVFGLQGVVAATTAWSGLSYAFLKNAVTILGTDEALKAKQGARGRAIIGVTFGSVVLVAAWLGVNREQGEGVVVREEEMEGGR
ncbi:unnamed protein product [Zymoseptoria tritici ST99CH_1E4]|uniref:Uncharacterized protein n=1 Tax=Zymoseptoria tritici ST99CH_1E4 TaxID=1276532 RepID=A0A2H1GT14_ZYMTR|nr:unnamed protein product [Zymoseptoria tritici ST99CH_1E4]